MFCPRCGAESEGSARYCASCGAELPPGGEPGPGDGSDSPSSAGGLQRLLGSSRRSRLLAYGTAAALVVAILAFVALDPAEEEEAGVPQDALTRALDAACVRHKAEIAAAQMQAFSSEGSGTRYAESLVPIVGGWRAELGRVAAPADREALADALGAALLEVEIEAGTLARAGRESNRGEVATAARRVDAATANVETAIESLGLERCGGLAIEGGRLVRK